MARAGSKAAEALRLRLRLEEGKAVICWLLALGGGELLAPEGLLLPLLLLPLLPACTVMTSSKVKPSLLEDLLGRRHWGGEWRCSLLPEAEEAGAAAAEAAAAAAAALPARSFLAPQPMPSQEPWEAWALGVAAAAAVAVAAEAEEEGCRLLAARGFLTLTLPEASANGLPLPALPPAAGWA